MTAPDPAPDTDPQPRILLAEDDARLAAAYERRLVSEGLAVDVVGSVSEAREHEQRTRYACLLLDRMLPDGDVLCLVHEIDERDTHPPIVLVSAVADEEDRVEGLRAGADDYIAKPVRLDELAVRVTRLMGAETGRESGSFTRISVGAVVFDLVRFHASIGGEPLDLPAPQLRILQLLMVQADEGVATEDLLEAVGDTDEAALAANIHELGRALDGALVVESTGPGYTVRAGVRDRRWRIRRRRRDIATGS